MAWVLNRVLGRYLLALIDGDFVKQNLHLHNKSPLEQMIKKEA